MNTIKFTFLKLILVIPFYVSAMTVDRLPDDSKLYTCELKVESKVNERPASIFTSSFIHSQRAEKIWWYRGEVDIEDMQSIRYTKSKDFLLYEAHRKSSGNTFRFIINTTSNSILIVEYSNRLQKTILEWVGDCNVSNKMPKREVYESTEKINPKNIPANILGFVCDAFFEELSGGFEFVTLSYIFKPQKKVGYIYKDGNFAKLKGVMSINSSSINIIYFEVFSDRTRKNETNIDLRSGQFMLEVSDSKDDLQTGRQPILNPINIKIRGSCKRSNDLTK